MDDDTPEYPLVALQFNLGAAPRRSPKQNSEGTRGEPISVEGEGGRVSTHIGRHLICEYLKQSLFHLPAFVALQDDPSNVDVLSIRDVLDERMGSQTGYKCVAWHYNKEGALPAGKKAALLYDSTLLIHDTENALSEEDFFHGKDSKARRLFKRLDGGLFLHRPSDRWVVAVSYHGEKNDSKEVERKEYLSGTSTDRDSAQSNE